MQAVELTGKEHIELVELEPQPPGPGEALLRVLCCGICGSDLHVYRGRWPYAGRLGHEFCAVVEQAGSAAGGLRPGMRVTGECFAHCGVCEACRSGHYNHCSSIRWNPGRPAGALAELVTYPASALLPVPDALAPAQAAMVEPLAVAFRAVSLGQVRAGESVAVIGGGTLGLLCASVAIARGAGRVFVLAKHPHQRQAASRLGALVPPPGAQVSFADFVREGTGGKGVHVAVDAVAAGTSLSTALEVTAPRGRVVEVGGPSRPVLVALGALVEREIRLVGSSCYALTQGRRDIEWALELITLGTVRPEPLITHTFPLAEAGEAFRTAADNRTGSIKVLVTMEA